METRFKLKPFENWSGIKLIKKQEFWKLFTNWNFKNHWKTGVWKSNLESERWRIKRMKTRGLWGLHAMHDHAGVERVPQPDLPWSSSPTEFFQYSSSVFSADGSFVDWTKGNALQMKIQKDSSSLGVLMICSMIFSGSF